MQEFNTLYKNKKIKFWLDINYSIFNKNNLFGLIVSLIGVVLVINVNKIFIKYFGI